MFLLEMIVCFAVCSWFSRYLCILVCVLYLTNSESGWMQRNCFPHKMNKVKTVCRATHFSAVQGPNNYFIIMTLTLEDQYQSFSEGQAAFFVCSSNYSTGVKCLHVLLIGLRLYTQRNEFEWEKENIWQNCDRETVSDFCPLSFQE